VFVVGMLLTPPDIISQTLLAIPMWILYEFGIVIGSVYTRKKADQEQQDNL
jgi:sec-independent protein translocase protein TatC